VNKTLQITLREKYDEAIELANIEPDYYSTQYISYLENRIYTLQDTINTISTTSSEYDKLFTKHIMSTSK
jgi:hypothetical protein